MKIDHLLLVALHECEGIGWKTINRIIEGGHLHEGLLTYGATDWRQCGLSVERANKMAIDYPAAVERCRNYQSDEHDIAINQATGIMGKLTNGAKVSIITALDDHYPQSLKSTPQPPWVLYGLGRVECLFVPAIAMVGTRLPTAYGRKMAENLSSEMAEAGFSIVSGMARGIDSIVHKTAIKSRGTTIAVLGAGIDVIYPPENRSLYEEIANTG